MQQPNLLLRFLKNSKILENIMGQLQCLPQKCLPIKEARSCALFHIDVNKGAGKRHNPHHTGHIQICKRDAVGSPLPA